MIKYALLIGLVASLYSQMSRANEVCPVSSKRCLHAVDINKNYPYLLVSRIFLPQSTEWISMNVDTAIAVSKADSSVVLIHGMRKADIDAWLLETSFLPKINLGKAVLLSDAGIFELKLADYVTFKILGYQDFDVTKCPVGERRGDVVSLRRFNVKAAAEDDKWIEFNPSIETGQNRKGPWLLAPRWCQGSTYDLKQSVDLSKKLR